ncbi:unnamed protein product [Urochloa humidicola]
MRARPVEVARRSSKTATARLFPPNPVREREVQNPKVVALLILRRGRTPTSALGAPRASRTRLVEGPRRVLMAPRRPERVVAVARAVSSCRARPPGLCEPP